MPKARTKQPAKNTTDPDDEQAYGYTRCSIRSCNEKQEKTEEEQKDSQSNSNTTQGTSSRAARALGSAIPTRASLSASDLSIANPHSISIHEQLPKLKQSSANVTEHVEFIRPKAVPFDTSHAAEETACKVFNVVGDEHKHLADLLIGKGLQDTDTDTTVMVRMFQDTEGDAQAFLEARSDLYNSKTGKWTGIVSATTGTGWQKTALYDPFSDICKAVLEFFGSADFFTCKTANNPIMTQDNPPPKHKPDFLCCCGPNPSGTPRRFPAFPGKRSPVQKPRSDLYTYALSPINFKVGSFHLNDILQVVSYQKEILLSQPGRRYVFGALLSEEVYRLLVLDERGTLYSKSFDYHNHPKDLVILILLLHGVFPELDGFHEGFSWQEKCLLFERGDFECILTTPFTWPRDQLFSRCTTGTMARPRDLVETSTCGKDREKWFLKAAFLPKDNIERQRMLHAVLAKPDANWRRKFVQQPVSEKSFWVDATKDTPKWRWAFSDEDIAKRGPQRHLVIEAHHACDSGIDQFQSAEELIELLIQFSHGHEWLFRDKRIIHRDVSASNIMRKRDPETGKYHAVLIDFDLAIPFEPRDDPTDVVNTHTGTKLYMSTMVLSSAEALQGDVLPLHDHLDDLESSLWVVVDVCLSFRGFQTCQVMHPEMEEWLNLSDKMLAISKGGVLRKGKRTWIEELAEKERQEPGRPLLSCILRSLLGTRGSKGMGQYFHDIYEAKSDRSQDGLPKKTHKEIHDASPAHYEEYRGFLENALTKLQQSAPTSTSPHDSLPTLPLSPLPVVPPSAPFTPPRRPDVTTGRIEPCIKLGKRRSPGLGDVQSPSELKRLRTSKVDDASSTHPPIGSGQGPEKVPKEDELYDDY
ncbi:hypothetical protein V5O48_014526 [Marasmius crinis-equi]|uniref:Fungal-type protein kinase domain-containing protein n=1 Tax=Marasmius crinis-equi TaxID=585013 RepID=A0ABR3EX09_9AGAR